MALVLAHGAKTFAVPGSRGLSVFDDVSLTVSPGASVAILGRSGSGKSTLLSILALLERLDMGQYEIDGDDGTRLTDSEASRLRGEAFGFVFQRSYLLGHLTAAENVEVPLLHARGWSSGRLRRHRVREVMDRVGISHRQRHRPARLSGGEQQLVAIARALVRQPRYVLADEPTGNLDPDTGESTVRLLRSLTTDQTTALVMVTHDVELAALLSQRFRLIAGGLSAA